MMNSWKEIRSIVGSYGNNRDLFLTLINAEGMIVSANTNMTRTLHLPDPAVKRVNFADLIHPIHKREFYRAMECTKTNQVPCSIDLYLRNGYYHPMKWQVNLLQGRGSENSYLCIGQKILDDKRLIKFNKLGEKNYQLIMDGLGAGVIFQDMDGEIIAANQKAAEILDVSLERFYQLENIAALWDSTWSITDQDGRPVKFSEAPFSMALQTGKLVEKTLIVRLKNGENRWIQYHSQPLFEEPGNIAYAVMSNIVDVTDERKLSSELQEKDVIFNHFMRQTPNLAWMVDEQRRLIFASASFYKYFNINAAEALHRPIGDVVPSEVSEALYGRHQQVLDSGKPIEVIEKARRANGVSYVFHINLFPITGINDKKLVGGYAVSLEEKYAVEKKLRETNERLLLLTRATTDAIWEWDMQTGHMFRNDCLMDMVGYQPDNPRGLSWWLRRIHPDDRNRVSDIVKDATEQGKQSWEDEYRFKCADGQYKIMRDKGYIVYENGLPVKMIGSLQDVTNIRNLENKLVEEKLRRQKEISEIVITVQEKERTRIGHELHDNVNQILSTTKMFVDLINPSNPEEKLLKNKSVDYLALAIEEIRKLSRELVVPQLKEKSLTDNIQSLVDDVHLSSNVKVNFTYDNKQEMLSPGKKVTFFRIIQEQLKNIMRHSQATQVNIDLQCRDNMAYLIIRDNGVGFDSGITSRGIGLSNIYERTRFYNGNVEILTAPGKGCTMEVSLPIL